MKIGKTSSIHQMSIQAATASTLLTRLASKGWISNKATKLSGPAKKPILRVRLIGRVFISYDAKIV